MLTCVVLVGRVQVRSFWWYSTLLLHGAARAKAILCAHLHCRQTTELCQPDVLVVWRTRIPTALSVPWQAVKDAAIIAQLRFDKLACIKESVAAVIAFKCVNIRHGRRVLRISHDVHARLQQHCSAI